MSVSAPSAWTRAVTGLEPEEAQLKSPDEETRPAQTAMLLWLAVEAAQGPASLRLVILQGHDRGQDLFSLHFRFTDMAYTTQFCDSWNNVPSISSASVLVQVTTTAPQMSETLS